MGLSLAIADIAKQYGGKRALDGCSLRIAPGAICALRGPNGCGKSTLLKICALLESASSGAVVYTDSGNALPHDLFLRRRISMVLSRVGIFNASVLRNVSYGLVVRGFDKRHVIQKAKESLETVGLLNKLDQNALTLSSGEMQRLGLARALAFNPEVLFLDEPTASIDEENTLIVESVIQTYAKRSTSTIVFSTHDRDQAERLASASVVMRAGKIVELHGLT